MRVRIRSGVQKGLPLPLRGRAAKRTKVGGGVEKPEEVALRPVSLALVRLAAQAHKGRGNVTVLFPLIRTPMGLVAAI